MFQELAGPPLPGAPPYYCGWTGGVAIANREERRAVAHVARVQPPAIVLERGDQRVELAPDRDVWRSQGRLQLPHAIDEHLHVVQAAQEVLSALQRAKLGRRWLPGDFGRQLDGVPHLLQGDADRVQSFGQIDRSRVLDGRGESCPSARHPGL